MKKCNSKISKTSCVAKIRVPKQRPMLFQDDMVNAILNGSKTQTRRTAKVTSERCKPGMITPLGAHTPRTLDQHIAYCNYQVGDILWVREAWRATETECIWSKQHRPGAKPSELIQDNCFIQYRATQEAYVRSAKWKPSIFMPRWASRIQLKVISIRLERLHDISVEDALSEGVIINPDGDFYDYLYGIRLDSPIKSYFSLWEKINGYENLKSNPWVWVTEFVKMEVPA